MQKQQQSRRPPPLFTKAKLAGVWIVAILLAYFSVIVTLGGISKKKAPELVIAAWPANGFALQSLAGQLIREEIVKNGNEFPDSISASTREIAERAFKHEPNAASAVAILALGTEEPDRRRLMEQSIALSRRDILTSGWMIFDSGKRDDLTSLLEYYDMSMRTSGVASSTFLPVIAKVLADDRFIDPLARLLAKNPPWAKRFWEIIIYEKLSLGNASTLRLMLADQKKIPAQVYADVALIQNLIAAGLLEEASRLYHRLSGEKIIERSFVRNGSFENDPAFPPFDWQIVSNGDFGADIDSKNGLMNISAIGSAGGVFARQLVNLPVGDFTFIAALDSVTERGMLTAELQCAQAITPIFKPIIIPLKTGINTRRITDMPGNCPYYWLDITGRASEGSNGFDASVASVSLIRK